MKKTTNIIVLVLFCGSINAVESQPTNTQMSIKDKLESSSIQEPRILPLDSYDVLIKQIDNINQDISLPESKHVTLGIYRADRSTLDVYIPPSVEKLTMHVNRIDRTDINIYAWHNPIIERIIERPERSNISNVMLPVRKYPYNCLALATLAVGAWWLSSEKK